MSDEALQSMTESLTKIDGCLSDLIAERDRLKDAVRAVVERCHGSVFSTDQQTGDTFHDLLSCALYNN